MFNTGFLALFLEYLVIGNFHWVDMQIIYSIISYLHNLKFFHLFVLLDNIPDMRCIRMQVVLTNFQFYLSNLIALRIFYILVHVVIAAGLHFDYSFRFLIRRPIFYLVVNQVPICCPEKRELVNKS